MISAHEYELEVVGTGHRVSLTQGDVTLDESWSPYVQASVTIPLPPPEVLAALDPRTGARCRLTLTRRFGSSRPIADLSADWSGLTLAGVSSHYAGQSLAAISTRYGTPYNAFGLRPSTTRRLNLGVRTRPTDYGAGRVQITLASDEALLQDMALVANDPRSPANATARAAVQMVLSSIGATLSADGGDGVLESDSVAWTPGQSAWDYVTPLVQAAGLRLWCDERRVWHLAEPLSPTEGVLSLAETSMAELEDDLTRDGDWYDAVHITYRWRDSSDIERIRYDLATVPGYSRVLALEYARPWPGYGAAAAMLRRTTGRGRVQAVTTVSDYSATPGQVLVVTYPGNPIRTGLVSRLTWDLGTDEMQVQSRDLTDTPPGAWSLIPAGVRWADIPAGMTWPNLNLTNGGT